MESNGNWPNNTLKLGKEEKNILKAIKSRWIENICDLFLTKKNWRLKWKFGEHRSIKAVYASLFPFAEDIRTVWYEELSEIANSIWWESIENTLVNITNVDHLKSVEQLQKRVIYRKYAEKLTILDVARIILWEPKLRILSREKLVDLYMSIWEFDIADKIQDLPEKDLLRANPVSKRVNEVLNEEDEVTLFIKRNKNRLNDIVSGWLSESIVLTLKGLGINNVIDLLTTSKESIEDLDLVWWYDLISSMSLITWKRVKRWEITDYVLKHVIHNIWWLKLKDEIAWVLNKKWIIHKQDLLELDINKFSKRKYYKDLRWIDLVNLLIWKKYEELDKIIMIDFVKRVWLIDRFTDKEYIDNYLNSWKTASTTATVIQASELFKS